MDTRKYIFSGNRYFVLQKMFELNLLVAGIFAIAGSYPDRELTKQGIPFQAVSTKKGLLAALEEFDYDVFVTNGCPFILPITKLKQGSDRLFVNIHPSLLPDLRGADPVPGAILYAKDSGVTCHIMNDEIDAGDIISQVIIPMTPCMDSGLLYQLSFLAEQQAFLDAYNRNFHPISSQLLTSGHVYYTFNEGDLEIDFNDDATTIIRKIKAFNTKSKGARFVYRNVLFIVGDAELCHNPWLIEYARTCRENEILFVYENNFLVNKKTGIIKAKQIVGNISMLQRGDILNGEIVRNDLV